MSASFPPTYTYTIHYIFNDPPRFFSPLSMKLTIEMVATAPSFINPCGERVLSLRSNHITDISSLVGIDQGDIYECIDLTNNQIVFLSRFPTLSRTKTLLVGRNRIRIIDAGFVESLPNLESLSLVNNSLQLLDDLKSLAGMKRLKTLQLLGNPVTQLENYRLWCIWLVPTLEVLDFEKVKDSERKKALSIYEKEVKPVPQKRGLDEESRAKLRKELEDATTIAEIEHIKAILDRGYI